MYFTAVYPTIDAADSCCAAVNCIPGRSGRDGVDGHNGIPGEVAALERWLP